MSDGDLRIYLSSALSCSPLPPFLALPCLAALLAVLHAAQSVADLRRWQLTRAPTRPSAGERTGFFLSVSVPSPARSGALGSGHHLIWEIAPTRFLGTWATRKTQPTHPSHIHTTPPPPSLPTLCRTCSKLEHAQTLVFVTNNRLCASGRSINHAIFLRTTYTASWRSRFRFLSLLFGPSQLTCYDRLVLANNYKPACQPNTAPSPPTYRTRLHPVSAVVVINHPAARPRSTLGLPAITARPRPAPLIFIHHIPGF